jgi:hypothetical protein
MLDELGGIINGFNSFSMLGILSGPGVVLVITGGLFSDSGGLVVFAIRNGLSKGVFSINTGLSGVISQLGIGSNLSSVIVHVVIKILSNLY